MRLTSKDKVGVILVAGTCTALAIHHAPTDHRISHAAPVADAGGAVTSAVPVPTYAFFDVNVLPMDRDVVLRRQVVLVRDGFVTRIGDVGVVQVPEGARRIDGGGTRYLAPGLTDAHVHLGQEAEDLLPFFLVNGITTVFNLEGSVQHLSLREEILDGGVLGPTLYTAGPFVEGRSIRSAADARRTVRLQATRGYDFVKVHGDLEPTTFEALTEAGAEHGIAVLGHAQRSLPIDALLRNGQVAITHAEELIYAEFMTLDPSEIAEVAEEMAEAGTWLTPSLVTFENTAAQWGAPATLAAALERPEALLLPSSLRRRWASENEYIGRSAAGRQRIQEMLAFHGPLVRTFHLEGVPMLAGTDAGMPGLVPGFTLVEELAALRRSGLSGYEALATATRNAGRFVREHVDARASFGTVRVGARADLVLLSGDPRAELDVLRRPEGVMLRGRWLDRPALDRMLPVPGLAAVEH